MNRWFPSLFSVVILMTMACLYFGIFTDLDWTWQVRTGKQILDTGSLRVVDDLSYTIRGTHLHDFEWLYEVALWLVWDAFGMGGLKFLRVALNLAPILIVARRLTRENVPWHGVCLTIFATLFVLNPVLNLRPLFCTTIGLLLISGWLHEHCVGRRPLSWWTPIVMLVWANCHPGVICGQALIVGAIGWEWINARLRLNAPVAGPGLKRLTLIGMLALAATFICPDPIERIRYTFNPTLAHPIHRIFTEMQPLVSLIDRPPYNFACIYLAAALTLWTIVFRFRQYRLWEIAYLAALALLGNFATRSAMDWYLNLVAFGVPHLLRSPSRPEDSDGSGERSYKGWAFRIETDLKRMFARPLFRLQPRWLVGGLAILFVVSVIPPLSRDMPMQDADQWPIAAVAFMEREQVSGNIFGPSHNATYAIWKLKDKARSYADTRSFFFPPVLIEDTYYLPMLEGDWRPRLKRVLDDYATDYFLLEIDGPRGELWRAAAPRIPNPIHLDDRNVLLSAKQVRHAFALDR